ASPENGSQRRLQPPGDVAVPDVLVAAHVLVLLEQQHLGIAVLLGSEGMFLELAEAPRELEVLLGRDVLVPEEDDLVREQRLADPGDRPLVERVAQVDTRELGADRRAERLHGETMIWLRLGVVVHRSKSARAHVKLRHARRLSTRALLTPLVW